MAAIVGNAAIVVNVMMVDRSWPGSPTPWPGGRAGTGLKQIICTSISNLLGTILAQAIFEPVARGLMILTRWRPDTGLPLHCPGKAAPLHDR